LADWVGRAAFLLRRIGDLLSWAYPVAPALKAVV
jgi:hypothetical protein